MKISISWLKDYLKIPADVTPEIIAHKLTFSGFEVEGVENLGKGLEKVVVGQILQRDKHPNADRLSLTKIDIGAAEPLQIVCGASNIQVGQKIPVALVGALLPNGLEIKRSKIRSVDSEGMLCSLSELHLPLDWQKEDGIFIQDPSAKVGTPFAEHLKRTDSILDINVTPNRGDTLSHLGMAREVGALLGLQLQQPVVKTKLESIPSKKGTSIAIETSKSHCSDYLGILIRGVKIKPSPEWLKAKVEGLGLRSINNVVDVTNFVLFEVGQPLHAFDAGKIGGDKSIVVRYGKKGESFKTISAKQIMLEESDLVVSDNQGTALALAGVMGGLDSEISDATTDVFLESACFAPDVVRKTAKRIAISTDASYRFERGVDPGKIEWAARRTCDLILEVAGGELITFDRVSAPVCAEIESRLRLSEITKLLGVNPGLDRVTNILRNLGFKAEVAAGEQEVLNVKIPSWRSDVRKNVDLIEEIIRIWGFENLQSKIPMGGVADTENVELKRRTYFQLRRVRRHLASFGFLECLNYGFTSNEVLAKVLSEAEMQTVLSIANPVSADYTAVKPSLLSGLLQNICHNLSHQQKNLRLFEMRKVYSQKPFEVKDQDKRTFTGVYEEFQLSLAITGSELDEFWEGNEKEADFYSLKGVLESIFELLGVNRVKFIPLTDRSYLHPGQSALLMRDKKVVGSIGRLHPRAEKAFGIEQGVYVAEIRLEEILSSEARSSTFKAFGVFPMVERDFSALVKDSTNAEMIADHVRRSAGPLLKNISFFDVFRGDRVPAGHVSYAFRVKIGSDQHTLSDEEISQTQKKIMQTLENELGAKFAGLA